MALLCLLAASLLALWGLGSHHLNQLTPLAQQEAIETLTAVAELKVRQITRWLMERRADAVLVQHTPYVARRALQTLSHPKSEATRNMFTGWLDFFMAAEPYKRALLLDSTFEVRLVHPSDADPALCEDTRSLLQRTVEKRYAILSDLHRTHEGGAIHMDLLVPFVVRQKAEGHEVPGAGTPPSGTERTEAMLYLQANAGDFLFPLLQSWPTPSRSAETLLVRRDGDDCLYLSNVRHQPGAAMVLRTPLTATDRAAVNVVLGREDVSDGLDYRGVPVLVASSPVLGTDWFMLAKIDRSEVHAPLRRQARQVRAAMGLLAVVVSLGVALLWRWREAQSLRDILQSERERLALAERVRHLMKGAHDIILLTDQHSRILEANDRAVESYGYSLDELQQMHLPDLRAPAGKAPETSAVQQAPAEDGTVLQTMHQRKDGSTFPVDASLRMVDMDGTPYCLGIFRDVTERQQLQAQLLQAQKLESIGTLAGGVAHEINNPINGIMNYAQLILDRLDGRDDEIEEFAREIGHESDRIAELVRNLLSFSRRGESTRERVRPCDVVAATLSLTGAILRHDQIVIELDVPEDLPEIRCRTQQIQQVLLNLLTNARDALNEKYPAHDENKRVQVRGSQRTLSGRRWVRLTVEDRGPGIPEAAAKRVFDPFYTTKRPGRGTGLGLSVSFGIVQDHGGTISVQSRHGEYTRFHIDLPVDTDPPSDSLA